MALQSQLAPHDENTWSYADIAAGRARFLAPALTTFTAYETPLAFDRGEGAHIWDTAGKRYLDCVAQNLCVSVGYSHPDVLAAVTAQMQKVQHITTMYYHQAAVEYAQDLLATFPDEDYVVHFVNSGAEAVDLAILLARLYTGHHELLSLRGAYHGMHFGAMSASGLAFCRQAVPASPGFVQVAAPDSYRGALGPEAEPYVQELTDVIDTATSGKIAGLMVEPVQGYGGIVTMPGGYLSRAAEVVRGAGGVMIVDEIQTGFGRTGSSFWAFQDHGLAPDIVLASKGIANGFPIAAVVMRREIGQAMPADKKFFNTYGSNPMACAAGAAVLKVIETEGLQANAKRIGNLILDACRRLADTHEAIGDVRGSGLLLGVDIVSDREAKTPDAATANAIQEGMRERGVIVGCSGRFRNVLRINPPLCIGEEDVTHFAQALDDTLASLKR